MKLHNNISNFTILLIGMDFDASDIKLKHCNQLLTDAHLNRFGENIITGKYFIL